MFCCCFFLYGFVLCPAHGWVMGLRRKDPLLTGKIRLSGDKDQLVWLPSVYLAYVGYRFESAWRLEHMGLMSCTYSTLQSERSDIMEHWLTPFAVKVIVYLLLSVLIVWIWGSQKKSYWLKCIACLYNVSMEDWRILHRQIAIQTNCLDFFNSRENKCLNGYLSWNPFVWKYSIVTMHKHWNHSGTCFFKSAYQIPQRP